MPEDPSSEASSLLQHWVQGDVNALGALVTVVYRELHHLARYHLQSERSNHTLQSTALVNEAFLRLLGSQPSQLQNRGHFVAVASRLMRQILVDYARSRHAKKRDGGRRIESEALAELPTKSDAQLVALNDALESLARIDERQARIVDMKFFGGLTAAEIAQVLDISLATVERDWAVARLWLRREMGRTPLQ
jgi:RNA polymerase sigma factor (TIGR02999 family)